MAVLSIEHPARFAPADVVAGVEIAPRTRDDADVEFWVPCRCGTGPVRDGVYDAVGRRVEVPAPHSCTVCLDTGWAYDHGEFRRTPLAEPYVILAPGAWERAL